MNATDPVPVRGARGTLEVTNPEGIFYKVLLDGEDLKQVKGRWVIPMRNGSDKEMRARGFLPGFQKLMIDGEPVYEFGTGVPTFLKVLMFLPVLLIIVNPFFGVVLTVLLFFLNVSIVKNPEMPQAMKVALPIINTVAVGLAMLLLMGLFG